MEKSEALEKKEVVKSNNLIESSYKLTTSEQRLIYLGSTKLRKVMLDRNMTIDEVKKQIENASFNLLEINVMDYAKEFNVNTGRLYEELTDTAERLFNRKIIYVDDDGRIVKKRWVITCKYDNQMGSIQLQFHPDLIKDLLVFKNKYTILQLEYSKQIRNIYSSRVYELIKQYQKYGERTFDLANFRFILGIEDSEYTQYGSFKQKVINPAIDEINKFTDMKVELEEIKKKRKVIGLKFKFHPQTVIVQKQLSFLENEVALDSDEINIIERLQYIIGMEIKAGEAQDIINAAFEYVDTNKLQIDIYDYIKEKNDVAYQYSLKNHVDTYIGLLIRAIKENWNNEKKKTKNSFGSYSGQREYDMKKLRKQLLGRG